MSEKDKNHKFTIDQLDDRQVSLIKERALRKLLDTSETRQVVLIIDSFLEFLNHQGYVVRKEEDV